MRASIDFSNKILYTFTSCLCFAQLNFSPSCTHFIESKLMFNQKNFFKTAEKQRWEDVDYD